MNGGDSDRKTSALSPVRHVSNSLEFSISKTQCMKDDCETVHPNRCLVCFVRVVRCSWNNQWSENKGWRKSPKSVLYLTILCFIHNFLDINDHVKWSSVIQRQNFLSLSLSRNQLFIFISFRYSWWLTWQDWNQEWKMSFHRVYRQGSVVHDFLYSIFIIIHAPWLVWKTHISTLIYLMPLPHVFQILNTYW